MSEHNSNIISHPYVSITEEENGTIKYNKHQDVKEFNNIDIDGNNMNYSESIELEHQQPSPAPSTSITNNNNNTKAFILYALTTIFLYTDQNLLAPNLTTISKEYDFTDLQRDRKLGGDLSVAFFLLGAPASILIGILSDKYPNRRSKIFAICVWIGEGSCFCTYFTKTYTGLFVTRLISGFSVGGAVPILYTLMGDYFPASERPKASAILGIGSGIGISLGQGIAGYIGPTFGWRIPFLIVSLPAMILAGFVFWGVKDPQRGGMEQLDSTVQEIRPSSPSTRRKRIISPRTSYRYNRIQIIRLSISKYYSNITVLFQIPSFVLLLIQGAFGCIPWGIVNAYLNDYLSEEQNMSIASATTIILFFGVGVFLGMCSGGCISTYFYIHYDSSYPTFYSGLVTTIAPFPLYALINAKSVTTSFFLSICIALLAGACAGTASPVVKSTVINVIPPQRRGVGSALHILFDDVGKGLGPYFISLLIQTFQGNRKRAFNIGFMGWFVCGLLLILISRFVERDEEAVAIQQRSLLEEEKDEDEWEDDDISMVEIDSIN